MIVAPLHRHFSPTHLIEVEAAMRRLGSPRIRAFYDAQGDVWLAREGTHRLRAAHALGVTPTLIRVPWWRTRSALERARFAAIDYGYHFASVDLLP